MMQHLKTLRPLWLPLLGASAGIAVMGWFLAQSLLHGDLITEGRTLMQMPWGVMSLVDIYTGLLLFSGWVFWREQHVAVAMLWLLALLLLGNLTSCLYVLIAVLRSEGRVERFFHGRRDPVQAQDTTHKIRQPSVITNARNPKPGY